MSRQLLPCLCAGIVIPFLFITPAHSEDGALPRGALRRGDSVAMTSIKSMRQLDRRGLEELYIGGQPGDPLVGFVRGEVLLVTDTSLPRVKRRLSGVVWKGKHFNEEGEFTNQFLGFRAITSHAWQGHSLLDGQP